MPASAPSLKTFDQRDWLRLAKTLDVITTEFKSPDVSSVMTEFPLDSPCRIFPDRTAADTHFLFLGIERVGREPLTIMVWRKLLANRPSHPSFRFEPAPWYKDEPFANHETCDARWYAPLTSPVPGTETFSDMDFENTFPGDTLKPIEIVTMEILHYVKYLHYTETGEGMRGNSRTMDGKHVCVKCSFDSGIQLFTQEIPPEPATPGQKAMSKGVRIPVRQA